MPARSFDVRSSGYIGSDRRAIRTTRLAISDLVVGGERPLRVESRCDAVALGSNISVAAPFVRRCLTGSTMSPFSHPAHRTGRADFPHPALGQNFTPSPTARRAQA